MIKPEDMPPETEALLSFIEEAYTTAGVWFGHGTTSAWEEAVWTLSAATDIDIDTLISDSGDGPSTIDATMRERTAALVNERITTRKPLAYLIGEAWFAGNTFFVDERAIVPRSHLGEWIPEQFAPWLDPSSIKRIIDIGTGSGCIAISLALAFPEAHVDATDLSGEALDVARRNVERYELENRVTLHECDLYPAAIDGDTGRWDLIVTNPPYVDDTTMSDLPDEYHHEPDMAFRGGSDGLDIVERIVSGAKSRLNPNGHFIIEAGTARLAMEQAWPDAAPMWLATSSGEDGIALIEYSDLMRMQRASS